METYFVDMIHIQVQTNSLTEAFNEFNNVANRMGLNINEKITNMSFNLRNINAMQHLQVGNYSFGKSQTFKYLGTLINRR